MDRGKENPRLDGVSALLVVSFRVRRLLLSPVCLGGLVLPSSNFEVFHSGFCASSDGGFETCGGVTTTATTTSLAGTHAALSFRFRVSFTRSSSSLPQRHRPRRRYGHSDFFREQLDARNRVPLIQYVVVSFDAYMCNLRPSPQYGKCCSRLPHAY
jgi:hypothetical protein